MVLVRLNEKYGIDNVKSFLSTIFRNLKIDRDSDGDIESNEILDVVIGLSRELFRFRDIANEFKDLSREEINQLTAWAEANFSQLTEIREDVELIVVRSLGVIHSVSLLFESIQAVRKGEPAVRYVGEFGAYTPVADEIFAVAAEEVEEVEEVKAQPKKNK